MKKFKVWFVGYSTTSSGKIEREEIVEANSKEEAKQKIEDRSFMGGYEYFVSSIKEVVENEWWISRKIRKFFRRHKWR